MVTLTHTKRLMLIKQNLKESKTTHRALAHAINIREDKLSQILNGKRPMSADVYVSICNFCGRWFDDINLTDCDLSQDW